MARRLVSSWVHLANAVGPLDPQEIIYCLQRDRRWVFADLLGKGKRARTVPVPAWVKVALDA